MEKKFYELTNPQKSILLTEQFYSNTSINNICGTAILKTEINFSLLEQAINLLVKNNDSFRLQLELVDNEVKQFLTPYSHFLVDLVDINSKEDLPALEHSLIQKQFNLYQSSLFCFKMFRFPDKTGGFSVNVHHIISDSWTLGLLSKEIVNNYLALLKQEEIAVHPEFSYLEYIQDEKEYLQSSKFKKDEEYWNNIFQTVPEIASVPSRYAKITSITSSVANRCSFSIPTELMSEINTLCSLLKVTAFNFFMAVYSIYIAKISNVNDFVLATPILNRTNFKQKNTSGMFINIAPFRVTIPEDVTFADFVSQIAKNSIGMLRHQRYPYELILEHLRTQDHTLPNLYNILLSYQITKATEEEEIEYETNWVFNENTADDIDVHLYDLNSSGQIDISYDYKISKYSNEDITCMHERILHIIKQIIQNVNLSLDTIEFVTPSEKDLVINTYNHTALEYDKTKAIIQFFEEQVLQKPNEPAITFKGKTLTYLELNQKANSLAFALRNANVSNNSIVGVMTNRSLEMMVSILAVLKAGGAYIPIDPDYPQDRIEHMLTDSKATLLLTQKALEQKVNCNNKILVDLDSKLYLTNQTNLKNISKPDDLSYLIYTSGSTGKPKGVMLTQKNLSNFYASMLQTIAYLKDKQPHSIVSITTLSFDIFGFETLISLCSGLHLYITDYYEQKVTEQLEKLIKEHNIEIIQTTPSVMRFHLDNVVNPKDFASLKYVMLAGEQLPKTLVERIKDMVPNCTIYNGYGPSETTIFSSVQDVTNLDSINIGRPIGNTQFYILDKNKNVLPPYCVGEIYIAGDGVGKGYLYQPELTNASFLANPFHSHLLLYKTGDLGRWIDGGFIECKGRIDHQVKLRGLRVELGEIEHKINTFKQDNKTKSAVIVKKEHGKDTLYAFIESSADFDLADLKAHLLKNLPNYMIPSHFVVIPKLPQTPNGKIDRKILQTYQETEEIKDIVKPQTATEFTLYRLICSILKINHFNMADDFFQIGMDSLGVIKLLSSLIQEFNVTLSIKEMYELESVIALAKLIDATKNTSSTLLSKKARTQDKYELSSAQKRVYLSSKLQPNTLLYNMPGYVKLPDSIDLDKLCQVIHKVVEHNASLRTYFVEEHGTIYQKVMDKLEFSIARITCKSAEVEKTMKQLITPFDLSACPLFKMNILSVKDGPTYLVLDVHHIICDGLSLNLFIKQITDLYNDKTIQFSKLSYIDYSEWEKSYLNSSQSKMDEEFWEKELTDFATLNLTPDLPRPTTQSFKGNKYTFKIEHNLYQKILDFCSSCNITPYMFLFSCYNILLAKYCNQEDIIVGTPVANRIPGQTDTILGMFVNTLPLRSYPTANKIVKDYLLEMKNSILNALEHEQYPFDALVNLLNVKRSSERSPIVDTMFIYQNDAFPIEIELLPTNIAKFDLSFEILPNTTFANVNIEYSTDLFFATTIEHLAQSYVRIIQNCMVGQNAKIANINLLSEKQQAQIEQFNLTTTAYPNRSSIVALFEKQVEQTPYKIALCFEDTSLTYEELNQKVNQLAHYLLSYGVQKGDIIGILLDKSLESIIAILSILKVGAAYLPIDIYYPKERIDYMIKDSKAKLVLTSINLLERIPSEIQAICIDLSNTNIYNNLLIENLPLVSASNDLAYIMYTSGSTGKPKGTMIAHKSIVRLVKNTNYIQFGKDERILQTGSIVFDACTFEIWGALLNGFTLYVLKKELLLDSSYLQDYLIKNKITILWLTAPLFNQLSEENPHMFRGVKYLLTGGDVLSPKHINMVKSANPNLTIINGYGPTENTTFSCCFTIDDYYEHSIPIGYPIANSTAYIVSQSGNLLPVGFPGELWVGGDGVALGYLNNETLTKEKFIKNPFGNGMIYKTGDLVRWLPNGSIEFLGRIDNQVKIRGFRVELNGITTHICNYPGIKEAVTVVQNIHDEKTICSYFVCEEKVDLNDLKTHLKKQLPNYMIPTYFMQLSKLPINTNGKIDKKQLPNNFVIQKNTSTIVAPRTQEEETLLTIFKNILKYDDIGITDNFFELGGDSLGAMKIQIDALAKGITIHYADIFKYPTVQDLIATTKQGHTITNSTAIDYSCYDDILAKNELTKDTSLEYTSLGNVLLTGFTGFLGAHILDSFIQKEKGTIYCLIREKNNMSAMDRLLNVLHFYFDKRYDKYIGNRICIVEGDITLYHLGLSDEDYDTYGKKINTVIHSAAMVKHFGTFSEFEKININGTNKVLDFCKKFDLKLMHISTISVSGNALAEQSFVEHNFTEDKIFNETNFYIGQNIENLYIKSKFEAENLVLDAIKNGLRAYIFRMGNLTSRFSEGKFQQNHFENAFVNRFKSILQIGYAPDYLLSSYVEFTPIDYCGDAIITLAGHYNRNFSVFHLLNEKHVTMDRLFETLVSFGIPLKIVTSEKFIEIINTLLKDPNKKHFLEGIINDLNKDKKLVYESNIKIDSSFTTKVLEKLGFQWPYIDTRYIRNYLKYLADIGYFNIDIH